ncbi:MAG TPA: M28 family metallopeptidase [Flavobacteriales bacterium]|nr:M28 family metallopeptidase [Flavobacteriales bacterium]
MSKRLIGIAAAALLPFALRAQHPVIQGVLDEVRIDSMMLWVSELSGEVPVMINGAEHTLVSRHKNNVGNNLAQQWLQQKLVQLGYAPVEQVFSTTGRNILVTKPGNGTSEDIVVICAHYDAMPGGNVAAPAADDDGSGVGALLEAARVLRDIEFVHPIVFALWDEEEQGLVGSAFYAGAMASNDAPIRAVINMDAIAYDGNADAKARIHTRPIANSIAIADTILSVHAQYEIGLDLILTNPGATYSDHASFWNEGYGAVLVIEEFNNDGNPYYHTPNDRVQHFDVPYYEKLAKLSIASTAALAIPVTADMGIDERLAADTPTLYAYPNPTGADAGLWLESPVAGRARITLHDALGQEVLVIANGVLPAGRSGWRVPLDRLPAGGYVVRAQIEGREPQALRLVKLP